MGRQRPYQHPCRLARWPRTRERGRSRLPGFRSPSAHRAAARLTQALLPLQKRKRPHTPVIEEEEGEGRGEDGMKKRSKKDVASGEAAKTKRETTRTWLKVVITGAEGAANGSSSSGKAAKRKLAKCPHNPRAGASNAVARASTSTTAKEAGASNAAGQASASATA